MQSIVPGSRESSSVFLWIKLIVFFDFFGVGLLTPILPSYLKSAGLSTSEAAGLSSFYYLAQLFGGVLFGWLSDKYFSRKQVLILSLIGSALAYLLFGLSRRKSLLIFSRILVGTVKHTMTLCTALLSDMTISDEKGDTVANSNTKGPNCVEQRKGKTEEFNNSVRNGFTHLKPNAGIKKEHFTSNSIKNSIDGDISTKESKKRKKEILDKIKDETNS